MKVTRLKILPSNKVFKLFNKGTDEAGANESKDYQYKNKDDSKVWADIFRVVIVSPHIILGNYLSLI